MPQLHKAITNAPVIARTAMARFFPSVQAGKVFAIGFNKAGTSSLHRLFEDLGLTSYHGENWRDTSKPLIYYVYDCFSDGIPDDFSKLDAMFPGSKFILQVRDLDAWIDSRLEHLIRVPRNETNPEDWSIAESSIQSWVTARNDHHSAVLRYFAERPDDFLLVNYIRDGEAAAKISKFLGRPAPAEKPHANKNPSTARGLKHGDMIAAALTKMGVPESEWKTDILCPSVMDDSGAGLPADTNAIK